MNLVYLILSLMTFLSISYSESQLVQNLNLGKKQTLVVYGTSLTDKGHWVNMLEHKLESIYHQNIHVINSGMSGKDSNSGLKHVQNKVIRHQPDTVLIEFGMNDAVKRFNNSKDHVKQNLESIIQQLKTALPNCEIILMTMNPSFKDDDHRSARVDLNGYYAIYRTLAKKHQLKCIDHYKNWITTLKDETDYKKFIPDGVHPNRQGSESVIYPQILKSLGLI